MPRNRNELEPAVERKIVALMARGGTGASIHKKLVASGVHDVSKRTLERRMRELQGVVKAKRAARRAAPPKEAPAVRPPPLPESPDAIPDGADARTIDTWLRAAQRNADAAEKDGDLVVFAQMGRLTASLLEAKRKAAPIPKEDPNEQPDMLAAKERARAEFHRLIELALGQK